MIVLKTRHLPIRDVVSLHDARRKVDHHYVTYLCPEKWLCLFETKRGARFTPPSEFPDKAAAVEYARSLR